MRDFNSTMSKSVIVPVLVNDKYQAINDIASPILFNFKMKTKILKFEIPQRRDPLCLCSVNCQVRHYIKGVYSTSTKKH
jgi:hypothetical protein